VRLLLAPHHDDILLSLAGELLSLRNREDHQVVVVFSIENPHLERICTRLHDQIGVQVHRLGFEEALRRGATVRDCFRTARSWSEVRSDPFLHSLQARLKSLLERLEPSVVCSPLLPIHLDHALVRAAAERVVGQDLLYYEDQPYASLYTEVLAEECAGLRPVEAVARVSLPDLECLLGELAEVVPKRHLERIYRHSTNSGAVCLWRQRLGAEGKTPSDRVATRPWREGCGDD
jgi:LmbE family N-acetylglucosaminyl deacetylase